ncbi:putative lipoxygenase [Richelia sinica FACHB-800]|uniref:Lipoxygenase n=1 Tax=Richelia sinica FACHB-800 TaxID=1357546 RepID=A0A975T4N3_9NOST|nr:lipoxygenase family protein [Richelia sinica]MBD2663193.1 lipoxygenase [Richelia sinica FACHB-800]QXE22072.1 putative lipoxygenase [Richelia sinica FACHB-800]
MGKIRRSYFPTFVELKHQGIIRYMSSQYWQAVEKKFQWEDTYSNLPGHVKGVPRGQGFPIKKIFTFLGMTIKGIIGLLIAQLLHLVPYLWQKLIKGEIVFTGTADFGLLTIFAQFNDWNSLDEFNEFFQPWTFFKKPDVAEDWNSDIEFGRQRLTGMNPILIRKCQADDISPSSNFPVTDELVNPFPGQDINLAAAIQANRLYILDFPILNQITTKILEEQLGRYPQSPSCLFYLDDKQQLIPIAIKLQYEPDAEHQAYRQIITHKSPPEDWQAAKVAVASADAAYQGVVSHLLNTHLLIEAFSVSTYRKISPSHILYQLLTPHYFNTLAINNMARNVFLERGGFFDATGALGYYGSRELLNRGYNGYEKVVPKLEFYKLALPYDLKNRDVLDLPNYYYRDDALLMWNAIKDYVTEVLQTRYQTDADVVSDREAQAWKEELMTNGNIYGLLPPERDNQLNSIQALIDIVTNVIFIATAQHAAVNFGQYDYAGWVPNNPFALYQSFSDLFTTNSAKIPLTKRLPNRLETIKQMVLVKVLTMTPPHSSQSLLTLDNPFSDTSAKQVFEKFQQRLQEIETQISQRNSSLSKPYIYLLPSRIPQSIAI